MRLAVIPARGGSKRIPRKNIKSFAGQPMIAYAIQAARQCGLFERIIASTDDVEIAEVARHHGAETPFMRPLELAHDHTPTVAVIRHAIAALAESGGMPEYVCCIYPGVPLLRAGDLMAAYQLLLDYRGQYSFPVTTFGSSVQRALLMQSNGRMTPMHPEYVLARSQDLPTAYHDAGQFYWGTREAWMSGESPHQGGYGLRLPRWLVQDIDTEEDWGVAEYIFQAIKLMNIRGDKL